MTSTLDYYNKNVQSFIDGTVSVDFQHIQDVFLELLPENAKILDFGCGSGRDTKYFLEHGCIVDAIDGSLELCKAAREYTGINVKHMLFQELNEMGNTIVMITHDLNVAQSAKRIVRIVDGRLFEE